MESCDRELKIFDMELNKNLKKIFDDNNRNRTHSTRQKYIKRLRSQAQNGMVLDGTELMDLNDESDLHYNGMDMQTVGDMLPSPGGYRDAELNYFHFDANIDPNPRTELETRQNQSLDDFFQDFNEIVSSDMKPTQIAIAPYDQGHHSLATSSISFSDQSSGYNSNVPGVDFNLDLTQFYINTNESDFLNSDELKTDFSNGLIHYPASQYNDRVVDESPEFSVMDLSTGSVLDLSNGNVKIHGNVQYNSTSQSQATDDQQEFSAMDHSSDQSSGSNQMADYTDTKISVSTPLNQFYLDVKVNGEPASAPNQGNSIVTYITENSLQSVEYINENGQTETVMYLDQQPDGMQDGKNGNVITQYEIINIDEYPYPTESGNTMQHSKTVELVSNGDAAQCYGESVDMGIQSDILSTLLADRSNKITIISKPMKNPKVRQSTDEFYLKFEEIDNNPTNIAFAKQPKVKGGRKQKLETINQIESEAVATKRRRSAANRTNIPKTTPTATPTVTTIIPETPKLPSAFMRDRRNKMQTKRKRPRKLIWNSESDCENGEQLISQSND